MKPELTKRNPDKVLHALTLICPSVSSLFLSLFAIFLLSSIAALISSISFSDLDVLSDDSSDSWNSSVVDAFRPEQM
jgi:hypothetical protein